MNVGNVNTYTYGYDAYGRLNGITTPAGSFAYTRPADSNLVGSMTRPNGVNSTWTFEEHRNLLASVTNGSVSTYAYTNDALGRRTGVTRSGSAFADTNILTYGYNPRSELTSALSNVNANYNFNYAYDPIGNRLNSTLAGTNWNYTANNLNQYTAFTSGSTTQDPTYDADGNMTLRDGWTQVWNGENRLIETYNETTKLTFFYDYMGRRIEKKVFQQTGGIWAPQKSLQYVYDGYKLVEEIDILPDEKPVLRRYTWQPETQGVDVPLVVTDVASNQNYFYTADANKNISELVDANGNTVAHYEYAPFGKITIQSGAYANNNPFQFSSEYFDTETGLVYYNYRYYSPTMGRWINKDPIQENGGWNLYCFILNNSINLYDICGLLPGLPPMPDPPSYETIKPIINYWKHYIDMRKANIKGADKYFHCLAHCDLARSVSKDFAKKMGESREILDNLVDYIKSGFLGTVTEELKKQLADSKEDLAANNAGINCDCKKSCKECCTEYGKSDNPNNPGNPIIPPGSMNLIKEKGY